MSRSKWKGYYIEKSIISKLLHNNKKAYVWSRRSVIPEFLLNHQVFVHNGKDFTKVYITREKIGYKFGEFALTRKFTKKQKKK